MILGFFKCFFKGAFDYNFLTLIGMQKFLKTPTEHEVSLNVKVKAEFIYFYARLNTEPGYVLASV